MWLSYSPDLNPTNFSVWAYMEKTVCSKKHTGIESFKKDKKTGKTMGKYAARLLRVIYDDAPRRLRDVIENNGWHIE